MLHLHLVMFLRFPFLSNYERRIILDFEGRRRILIAGGITGIGGGLLSRTISPVVAAAIAAAIVVRLPDHTGSRSRNRKVRLG